MFTVAQIEMAHAKVNSGADLPKYIQEIKQILKSHQQGQTNYYQFCKHCAQTGIEKWIVNLYALTCTYYDKAGNTVLVERIPT